MSLSVGAAPNTDWIFERTVAGLIRCKASELARSPGFSRSDQPDIEQEFRLHLLRKATKFNAARAKVTTFAKRLIENKATSMARKAAAQKRTFRRNSISLNEEVANGECAAAKLADLLDTSAARRHTGQRTRSAAELAHLKLDVAEANRDLPSPLRKLAALLSHVPPFPAGEVLGISRRQTRRCMAALREAYEVRGLNL